MSDVLPSFFDDEERRARLAAEALRWIGTPFVSRAAVCRGGVDCVHLCAEIYRAVGFLDGPLVAPAYAMDCGHHMNRSLTIEWIEESGKFDLVVRVEGTAIFSGGLRIRPDVIRPGDALCFRNGRVAHHAGLQITDGTFIQAHRRYGVIVSPTADPTMLERLVAVYRPRADRLQTV